MREGPAVVVLGAGPAGLGCAWSLARRGIPVEVLEVQDRVGGLAGSFRDGPFTLDFGPHKFFTRIPGVLEEVRALMGEDLLEVPKRSGIWLRGRRFDYPFRMGQLLFRLGPVFGLTALASTMAQRLGSGGRAGHERTYEDYLVRRFGRVLYRMSFEPMAWKVWGDPKTLSAEVARVRVVFPSLWNLLWRMLHPGEGGKTHSARTFFYPRGGFGSIWEAVAREVRRCGGVIHLGVRPERIRLEGGSVRSVAYRSPEGVREIPCAAIVSSIPLSAFLSLLDPGPGPDLLEDVSRLRYRGAILCYLFLDRPSVLDDAWIFFPEREIPFNRIMEQKRFSPHTCPPDGTVLCADIAAAEGDDVWRLPDDAIARRVRDALERMKILDGGGIRRHRVIRIQRVYPVLDVDAPGRLARAWAYLDGVRGAVSVGRHGYFQHNNSDNALDMGFQAADHVLRDLPHAAWRALHDRFDRYQIVD
ncbi:MAG: FAD-dependent oxidoreductase [Planctomycetes bacterium]|nr:FAD-dependent oxidoreductase [Planctomycetota bacterium]